MNAVEAYYNNQLIIWGKVTAFFIIIPLLFGLYYWRRLNKPLRVYWYFLLISLLIYVLEQLFVWSVTIHYPFWKPILNFLNIGSTNFFRIFYQINNFGLLGQFLVLVFYPSQWAIRTKWLSIVLIGASLLNYFFIQGHNAAGGFNSAASSFYCFILPLIYMRYLYNQDSKVHLVNNPYFWICLGLVIPNLLGLFLYFTGDVLYNENFVLYVKIYLVKNGIEIIALLLTAVGFYYAQKAKYLTAI